MAHRDAYSSLFGSAYTASKIVDLSLRYSRAKVTPKDRRRVISKLPSFVYMLVGTRTALEHT